MARPRRRLASAPVRDPEYVMVSDVTRTCAECSNEFVITADEQAFFQQLAVIRGGGWQLPRRCGPCRFARRAARYGHAPCEDDGRDEWLVCTECGERFVFGGRDKQYFVVKGFAKPTRCRPCRVRRRGWRQAMNVHVHRRRVDR